jgi:hypothetical protein
LAIGKPIYEERIFGAARFAFTPSQVLPGSTAGTMAKRDDFRKSDRVLMQRE